MNIKRLKPSLYNSLIFVCTLATVQGVAAAENLSCPGVADYQALLDFYNSTNGSNWTNQTGWADGVAGTDCTICDWAGVNCDDNGRVTEIFLSNNNLAGTIPPQIANLDKLEKLYISNNSITGSIPSEIGNLPALQNLIIYNNLLTGAIPSSIGNLTNLESFHAYSNDLTGQIPSEIGNLSSLNALRLNHNALTGSIPSELFNLTNLTQLYLYWNDLSGPLESTIGNLTSMQDMRLNNNDLSGGIPAELGNLTAIAQLYLNGNNFEGCIPSSLQNLCGNDIRLQGNPCLANYGSFDSFCSGAPCENPEKAALMALYNATGGTNWTNKDGWGDSDCGVCGWQGINCDTDGNIVSIFMYNNNLIGTIPTEIGNFQYLRSLSLQSNQLTGQIPSSIGNISTLESLRLESNSLTGSIPLEMGNLLNLEQLYINSNDLSGPIPAELGNLTAMLDFRAHWNSLSGEIPADLGNMVNVNYFYLHSNELNGCIPSTFQNLCGKDIRLGGNSCLSHNSNFQSFCTGQPCENPDKAALVALYNATGGDNWTNRDGWGDPDCGVCAWDRVNCDVDGNVIGISLSNNNLIGTLPPEIGNFQYLESLSLSYNQLTGQIPASIGNLSTLKSIRIESNSLSGSIPPEMGNLSNLEKLYMASNDLSGSIPPELGNLTAMLDFRANWNSLSGEIPPELAGMANVNFLFFNSNDLEGCIPSTFQSLCGKDIRFGSNQCLSHGADFSSFCAGDPCEGSTLNCNTCYDGILNGTEEYIDCGGICDSCGTCTDGIQNGSETAIDCGGECNACDDCTQIADYDILMAFYNATGGANWTDNSGWGEDCGVCSWYGVGCNNAGVIESLQLGSNNLTGSIPPEIGNLDKLIYLSLSNNNLSGSLPTEIGNLTQLISLQLYQNNLSSSLPSSIGNLVNVTEFNIHDNQFSGSIPTEIGNMVSLTSLGLFQNQFTGSIPPSIGNLTNLTALALFENMLDGAIPPELGNLVNVNYFQLQLNQLTGPIPPELSSLMNVSLLNLSQNQLSGCIPSELNALCSISGAVNLTQNPCLSHSGGDFTSFCAGDPCEGSSPSCTTCSDGVLNGDETAIDCGGICEPCPTCEDGIKNGTETGVDCGGATCGECECLQTDYFDDLMALYDATAGDNWTNNTGWGQNCDICNWHGIECDNAGVIENINLTHNNLTGPLPVAIGNISPLKKLLLFGNNLNSSLPSSIGNLVNLTELSLSDNQFSGPIPMEVGNMTSLTFLFIQQNQLTGPIPPSIGNMSSLINLALFDNQIDGSIPPEMGNITSLLFFQLQNNKLTGPIPSELSLLTNLINGKLSQNQLTGCIPSEFSVFCSGNNLILDQNPCLSHNGGDFNSFCAGDPCEGSSPNCSSCSDGILNGDETEIDCGGICPCLVDCSGSADFEALMALYNSTNGANWNNNSGWAQGAAGTDCDYCTWDGITCDANNRVTEIDFFQNNMLGPLPAELGQLSMLTKLYIRESGLTGTLPPELGNLTALEQIVFFGNQLTGPIPSSYSALTNLTSIGFGYNQLSGEIPLFLSSFSGLTFLALNGNNFEGAIPKELGNLSNIENLFLGFNNLSGCIPASFQAYCGPGYNISLQQNPCLSHGSDFYAFCGGQQCVLPTDSGCDFSSCSNGIQDGAEEGVDCCGLCPPCQVDCSANPDFTALMAFYDATNGPAWGDYGWNGGAAGTDCDVCNWQGVTCNANGRVTELYFKAQNLSGQLPTELDQLTELISLKLEYNVLTGSIPTSLGNLQNLQSLYLNGNNLVGEMPTSLSNLNQLQYLNLSQNQLSGCYDPALQSLCAQLDPSSSTNSSISDGNMFDAPWEVFCSEGTVACDCPSSYFADGQLPVDHDLISLISNDCPTRGTVRFNSDPSDPCAEEDLFWMLSLTETPPVDINDDRILQTTQDFMYLEAGTYFFYLIQRPVITLTDIVYLAPTTIVIDEVECFPCIDDVVIDEQTNDNLGGETIRSADYIEVSDVDINQDLDTWAVDYFEIAGPFEVESGIAFSITIEDECECTIGSPCDDEDPCTINDTFDDNCACIGEMDPACVPDCTDGTDHGDPCDDGDACTENDLIDTDCNCVGTTIPNCTTDCADGKNYGDPCDDGDACTENDEVDTNCDCIGVAITNCTSCPSGEEVGTACDDLDECTENDLLQIDSFGDCECVGVLIDENNNGECDFLEPCDDQGEFLARILKSNDCNASQYLNVVVSEFSNGEKGVDEYIELYVKGKGSFDLRGLIIDDKEGGYQSGNGFSAGRIRFANHPNWAKVKGGSIILIYNDKHRNKNIGNEDPTDANSDNIYISALSQPYFYGEELNAESKYIPIPPAWDLIWLYDKNDEINIRTCDEQLLQRISYGYTDLTKPTFGEVIQINKSVRKGFVFKDMMDTHVVDKEKASPGEYNNRKHKNFIKNGN